MPLSPSLSLSLSLSRCFSHKDLIRYAAVPALFRASEESLRKQQPCQCFDPATGRVGSCLRGPAARGPTIKLGCAAGFCFGSCLLDVLSKQDLSECKRPSHLKTDPGKAVRRVCGGSFSVLLASPPPLGEDLKNRGDPQVRLKSNSGS